MKHVHATDVIPDVSLYFPTEDDYVKLKNEFKILMARDLIQNEESLKWMEEFVPKYISHQYDDLVKTKSHVVYIIFLSEIEI